MTVERVNPSLTQGIRIDANRILYLASDKVQINYGGVLGPLSERLKDLKSQQVKTEYKRQELSLGQELGLSLFFGTVNFCFADPNTGKEYRYNCCKKI